ncbi:MAG: invasion associated locus B family protein [Pseudomonadota bacterium]
MTRTLIAALVLLIALPAAARDSLGVYSQWAAFRDVETPRCYAIASTKSDRTPQAYVSVGTWPALDVRGQLHIRLSRRAAKQGNVRLTIGSKRFDLSSNGQDAWAADKAMDAAIIAAMRSATRMSVGARSESGTRFTDRYSLEGAATAMDAAVVGCAEL